MMLRVIIVIHVDDILMLGNFEKCLEILNVIKETILIRETGRASLPGEKVDFVGKPVLVTKSGFKIQG